MKKIFIFAVALILSVNEFITAQTIADAIRELDTALMSAGNGNALVTIGAITYEETETCGTIVPYIQKKIKEAAEDTRRIKIVSSSQTPQEVQKVVATRGVNMGMMKKNVQNENETTYILDGNYKENAENVEIIFTLLTKNGSKAKKVLAKIPLEEVRSERLSLYPGNVETAKEIHKDFENAQNKTTNGKIKIAASMLDKNGNLVNILHPGDIVRFRITSDSDAYIAIQGFDAENDMYWLPVKNNFIKAGETREFPDDGTAYQVMDGIFGAEHLVIHAASEKDGLPEQSEEAEYQAGMIGKTRGLTAVKTGKAGGKKVNTGAFKISYTVIE